MTKQEHVVVNSARLRLEPFVESCICAKYLAWLNDPQVVRFSNQRFCVHTLDSARHYVASFAGSANLFLAIRLLEGGQMIGTMTAYISEHHRTADMGLLIGDRCCWGKGYGSEAWSVLMSYLFDSLNLRKITGGTVRANVGMRLIMERAGMHQEAVRSRQEIVEGVEEDVLYFARFRDR
jgi:[ribosomal protein S5]-alanine N-acetyltransferase